MAQDYGKEYFCIECHQYLMIGIALLNGQSFRVENCKQRMLERKKTNSNSNICTKIFMIPFTFFK